VERVDQKKVMKNHEKMGVKEGGELTQLLKHPRLR
jgi:hypothetical protein